MFTSMRAGVWTAWPVSHSVPWRNATHLIRRFVPEAAASRFSRPSTARVGRSRRDRSPSVSTTLTAPTFTLVSSRRWLSKPSFFGMSTMIANAGRAASGRPTPRTMAIAGASFDVAAGAPGSTGSGSTTIPPNPAQLIQVGSTFGASTCSHGPAVSGVTVARRAAPAALCGTASWSAATTLGSGPVRGPAAGPPTHGSAPVVGTSAIDAPG